MTSSGKRRRRFAILTTVLVVGLLAGSAWSQSAAGPESREGARLHMVRGERGKDGWGHGKRHERRGGQRYMDRMIRELALNDEQVTAIRDLFIEARKQNIKLRAEARVARIELGQLITGGEVNKASVHAKVDQIATLEGDLMRQRADTMLAVREILTPEQRKKADRTMAHMLEGPRRHHRR